MPTTITEIALSAVYRDAQRSLAGWLETGHKLARHKAFSARAAVALLDRVERQRLARWLAWLCVASASRGQTILPRIRRLDGALGNITEMAISRLPAGYAAMAVTKATLQRMVSADTAPRMTSVGFAR